jgi:hypothetical protein
MRAEVKNHNGTPAYWQDGRPVFYSLMWGSPPGVDEYGFERCARRFAEANVHLFTFDVGTTGTPPEWCGPKPGLSGHFDFSTFATRMGHILEADPQARFHLRIQLEMPDWWLELYPEECERVSDGRSLRQSFASQVWRRQVHEFLRAMVDEVERAGLGERVVAYQCAVGSSGEWVKGPSAMGLVCGDYSQPMQAHFRQWLAAHYKEDTALQAAWNQPDVTLSAAQVPSADAQFNTTMFTFRDPRKEQPVVDYYTCLAELSADLLLEFCRTVKEACESKALVGAFYGYLLELSWNAGFFGEGLDSEYSTVQRSGHLGLGRVLRSPDIDFLASPYSYGLRGIGGDGSAMPPTESLRLHGKLYIFEDDTRTYLAENDRFNYGKAENLEESLALLKRNFAYVTHHGHGIWWLAGWNPQTPHVDLDREPAFRPLIAQFQQLGQFALHLDRTPGAQIAVLLDDESFYYENPRNTLDLPLIYQQRLWGLPHMGAPFDVYLLNDLLEGRLPPYKLYVFLNAFHLMDDRREALKRQLRKNGQTALWIYAPGYLKDTGATEHMTDLTGIQFEAGEHPWGPLICLLNSEHPITRRLSPDLTWGTNSALGPVFHVEDPDAVTLGNVVYSKGRNRPGFVVKEFGDWRSVYSAAPNLPASVLREIARYAGVHIYSERGDTLYASRQLVTLHTAAGGPRAIRLPSEVETVYELFEGREVARNTDHFDVDLKGSSTQMWYTGDRALLERLTKVR